MVLGDHFPQGTRVGFVEDQLQVGSVLYLHCPFTRPPKLKYLLVACLDPVPLVYVINSKINDFKQQRPALLRCQVRLDQERHNFLRHDSYIDCAYSHQLYPTPDDLAAVLAADLSILKGVAQRDILEQVLAATMDAETLSRKHQRWITAALEAL